MVLILKQNCREKLRIPFGKLLKTKEEILKEVKNKKLISVGDEVTKSFLKWGIKPKMAIVDYKIKRKKINYKYNKYFEVILKGRNKPGQISEEIIKKIKEGFEYECCLIEVEGEEDLLILPVALELDKGVICYGQPNEGVVCIKMCERKRRVVKKIIKECFEDKPKE